MQGTPLLPPLFGTAALKDTGTTEGTVPLRTVNGALVGPMAWSELTNTPTTLSGYGITDAATSAQGSLADTAVQPGDLATVATTGSYTDLLNKPTITTGTVESVGLALPSQFTVTGSPVTSTGTLTAAWASQTQAHVLAAPSDGNGTPTFRALVATDIPTLNQNTTGTAANVTGIVAIANGGTGTNTAQLAINALAGAVTSGQYLRGDGTNVVMSAIQAADVPTLNQNTTGTAANVTGTVAIANGGTGTNTAQLAINALAGTVTSGQYLRGNGTNVVMSAIQAADIPTLNQNTTGTAANVTGVVALANGGTGATTDADARTNLGLTIGTNVQAYDADLAAIAALTTTGVIDRTGDGTATTRTTGTTGLNVLASADAAAARVAISAAENLEIVDSWRDGSQVTNWARFQSTLNTIIAKNRARGLPSGARTIPTGTYPGTGACFGGVLLPDGRVFCVPCNATTARIYDPATDTLTTPTGTYPGSAAYLGGVLLPDGRVFCVPFNSTSARIYDPATDTLTTPTGTYPGSAAYLGGVLLPDGRVFCMPYAATTARIYDPTTDTLTTPTGTYPGNVAHFGGVLLPDGRVFCVPYNATTARIYDPVTDTLTTPTGTYPGTGAYAGGVLLPDGRVFCVPASATTARIYDPAMDTLTIPTGTYPGTDAHFGGVLLPDGRVFCVPFNTTSARIYDPVTDTLTTPTGTYPGTGAYAGGVLLPDGRVFCVPHFSTTAAIAATRSHVGLDSNITLSPFFNKC